MMKYQDKIQITSDNLIKLAVEYVENVNRYEEHDDVELMDVLHDMISDGSYVLSEEILKKEMDYDTYNYYFLSIIDPDRISKDILSKLVFRKK